MENIESFVHQIMELVQKDYVADIKYIVMSVIFLLIGRIWRRYNSQKDQKKQILDLRKKVVYEIDYGVVSGVGNRKCQFVIDAISKLAHQTSFDSEILHIASKIVTAARLCNACGGEKRLNTQPGEVKKLMKQLKNLLQ